MTAGTTMELENGKWVEAKPIPYYPSVIERVKHFFGIHTWTICRPKICVICHMKGNL